MKLILRSIFIGTLGLGTSTIATASVLYNYLQAPPLIQPNVYIETNKHAKHYFVIMADSMSSLKLQSVLETEKLENKFNGWNLKMNVLSPGYGTETGLSGVLGGPRRTAIMAQFRGQKISANHDDAWENLISDISSIDMKHIYLSNTEGYGTGGGAKFASENNIKDPKNKIITLRSSSSDNENSGDLLKLVKQVNANENNFSMFISDIAHINGYHNAYYNSSGGGLVNELIRMNAELKRRHMFDSSYILVVSDHGRGMEPNFLNEYKGKYMNLMRNKILKQWTAKELNSQLDPQIKSLDNPQFTSPEMLNWEKASLGGGESFVSSMASIFYKGRMNKGKLDYDDKNLYANYDVVSIIYHDLLIDDKNITFNLNTLLGNSYSGSSYNSYIKDPIHSDLSERKLFVANKNNNSGFWDDLHFGKQITLCKGPFTNPKNHLRKFILDKLQFTWKEMPFLEKESIKERMKSRNGFHSLGKILTALEKIN